MKINENKCKSAAIEKKNTNDTKSIYKQIINLSRICSRSKRLILILSPTIRMLKGYNSRSAWVPLLYTGRTLYVTIFQQNTFPAYCSVVVYCNIIHTNVITLIRCSHLVAIFRCNIFSRNSPYPEHEIYKSQSSLIKCYRSIMRLPGGGRGYEKGAYKIKKPLHFFPYGRRSRELSSTQCVAERVQRNHEHSSNSQG